MSKPLPILRLNQDEDTKVPVYLETHEDWPATAIEEWMLSARYSRNDDSVMTALSLDGNWSERGDGFYMMTLPASILDQEGAFELVVEPPASGGPPFLGFGYVDKRVEDRVRDASVTGSAAENTVERAIYDAGNRFEVFAVGSYDFDAGKLNVVVFLHRNGVRVTDPTSGSFELREEADTVVSSDSSASPNSDGVFHIEVDPQTPALNPSKVYSLRATVVHDGVTYNTLHGAVSFN